MNPWPDDYTEAPSEQDARKAWGHECPGDTELAILGHYLHHLTEEHRALLDTIEEQWATIRELEAEIGGRQ